MSVDELEKLQNISLKSLYSAGVMQPAIRYCFKIFRRYMDGDSILEMGPAEGVMTALLATTGKSITVVEGSELFCENLKANFPDAQVINSLFEDFVPDCGFDNIVLGHVLEHVDDPVDILQRAAEWLNPGGRILAAVPNARSLHRQAAVIMGVLAQEGELNELDKKHGHRRVFNPESFRNIFYQAGFVVDVFGGYWLKPLANSQIEDSWTPEMVDAFMQLGERYPDIAGEIYVVASTAEDKE